MVRSRGEEVGAILALDVLRGVLCKLVVGSGDTKDAAVLRGNVRSLAHREVPRAILVCEAPHLAAYRAVDTVCADENVAMKGGSILCGDFDRSGSPFDSSDTFFGENFRLVAKVVIEDLDEHLAIYKDRLVPKTIQVRFHIVHWDVCHTVQRTS